MRRRIVLADGVWLLCFGVASTIWCLSVAATLGPTFDEPTYIRDGLQHWQTGSYKQLMRLGTMPLAVDVQTLVVRLVQWWRGTPLSFDQALRCARAGTLVFWWALLFYALRAGRMIGGNWSGRIAVALVASEPVLLGHAALATADVPVSACLLALTVEFCSGRESRWPRRIALPAVLYGLAILAKASALVLGPICLLVVEADRVWRASPLSTAITTQRQSIRRRLTDIFTITVAGLLLTFVYCGSDWTTERTFVEWAQTLPAGKIHDAMLWTSEHLKIFTNAGEGLAQQIKHNIRGHGAFILGHVYRRAVWFYFPVALSMKLSLALLIGVAVIAAVYRAALRNWACLLAVALLTISLTFRVQIGIRLILPLIAFLCIGIGAATAIALRQLHGWKRGLVTIWLVAGVSSAVWASVRVWPHAICFTNAAWGGTTNGYRLLSDSNYDWGQGLPDLRKWTEAHNESELNVWYFGSDPSVRVAPLKELPLHLLNEQDLVEAVNGKVVAVSLTLLYGSYTNDVSARNAVALFRSRQPIDRTMTFFIYDFRQSHP